MNQILYTVKSHSQPSNETEINSTSQAKVEEDEKLERICRDKVSPSKESSCKIKRAFT